MPATRSAVLFAFLLAAAASAQGWVAGPAVPTAGGVARAAGTGLFTSDGLLLLGGTPPDSNGDAPVHRLLGGAWQATTPLEGLFLHGGAAVDSLGRVIVLAGVEAGGQLGDSFHWTILDGNAGGIQERNRAPDQGFALATDASGLVYSLGGSAAGSFARADGGGVVERYDAASNTWTTLRALPTPVADAAACYDGNGHVLVCGGYDTAGNRTANVALYDIATDSWSDAAIADLPAPRAGAQAVRGADGLVYLIGGSDSSGALASTLILDAALRTWVAGPTMLLAREHFGAALDGSGNIWAIGGDSTNTSESLFTPTCPRVLTEPSDTQVYLGAGAGFRVTVGGSDPFSYQWRADGVPLVDGPTGWGSIVQGATTDQLGISALTAADGLRAYDCVITNACGSTTSRSAQLTVRQPAALPVAFLGQSLHPTGALSSSANSVDGTVIVGDSGYAHATYGTLSHPRVWTGLGRGSSRIITPSNSVGGSAFKVRNDTIVGWWWWPYTTRLGTGYHRNASVWTQAGNIHHQAQPSGWEYGLIYDTDGTRHVGSCTFDDTSIDADGFYWPSTGRYAYSLTPTGNRGSGCTAVDGNYVFGSTHIAFGVVHAAMWDPATREFFDLNPDGASRSSISAAEDGIQIGSAAFGGTTVSGVWSSSRSSFVPLSVPAGAVASLASCRYGLLLGTLTENGVARATVWRGASAAPFDLHRYAPPGYRSTVARDVYVDPVTGEVTIVGSGYNENLARTEALVWRGADYAAEADRLGQPCPVTLAFTPDGRGGYLVQRTVPQWFDDRATGSEIAAGGLLPENTVSAPLSLGFTFSMPGGVSTTSIVVDDNGRVLADTNATSSSTPTPSAMRLGPAVIAPFWTDLSTARGSLRFTANPGAGLAVLTWRNVPQAGMNNGYTFQLRLRVDGSFAITYVQVSNWMTSAGALSDNVLVGCSAGGGIADPGASDFAVYPIDTAGAAMVYQWWLAQSAPAHPEVQAHLHVTQLATVGGALELDMAGATSATLASFLVLGGADPGLDLTPWLSGGAVGLDGCVLHASLDLLLPMTRQGSLAQISLPVPAAIELAGQRLFVQGLQVAPGESAVGAVPSDAFAVTIGH
ncbi:MAG: kelch repeat-containing protein [Planctomycetota bacterium]